MVVSARTCSKCRKNTGAITPILGAYWHEPCYRKATPIERRAAAIEIRHKQDLERQQRDYRERKK